MRLSRHGNLTPNLHLLYEKSASRVTQQLRKAPTMQAYLVSLHHSGSASTAACQVVRTGRQADRPGSATGASPGLTVGTCVVLGHMTYQNVYPRTTCGNRMRCRTCSHLPRFCRADEIERRRIASSKTSHAVRHMLREDRESNAVSQAIRPLGTVG